MRQIHYPVWLGAMSRAGSATFIALFALETLTRATLVTVLPLKALALLGDAQQVSVFYFTVSLAGLVGTLSVPWLVSLMRRRWLLSISMVAIVAAMPLLAGDSLASLVAGFVLYLFGGACATICLNLIVLDHIPRAGFARFEPVRMWFSGAAWVIGPALGIYLEKHVAGWMPFVVSGSFAVALLIYYWFLKITDNPIVAAAKGPPPNPLRFIKHFFGQPRLSLAWLLAVGRAGWWGMFYIYAPIYAVSAGLGEVAGGVLVSAGSAAMFAVTFWGWVGRRYGIRRLLIGGYIATGVATLGVAAAAGVPWLGAALLVLAAGGASSIDGAGNIPFLRAVKSRERAEMTTVYSSYRDASRLTIPGVYAIVLQVFALPAVFATGGIMMLGLAHFARHIPRRL